MKHLSWPFMMLLFVSTTSIAATVYKKVDEDGNIIFSDTPMDDAETLDVPPVPTLKLNHPIPAFTPKEAAPKTLKYTAIKITSPEHDATFVNNQGKVTIDVQVTPKLNPKHQVELLLNGVKRAGPSASTSFSFSNLDRGSYSATAQVIDEQGKVVISSPPVPFHIKRAFVRN